MREQISQTEFEALLGVSVSEYSVEKLFGEASARQYFRIQTEENPSYILMQLPEGPSSVTEEIGAKTEITELPFLNVQRFLAAHQINVPRIIAQDLSQGRVLLDDLGDQTLEKVIQKSGPEFIDFFYKKAIDLLVQLQKVTKAKNSDCLAFEREFDLETLEWEFQHFVEYGLMDRLSIKLDAEEKLVLQKVGQDLSQKIKALPYVFCHRDFQSRNLMLHGYDFYLIDFQDALQGPLVYDLVALLRDSYFDLGSNSEMGSEIGSDSGHVSKLLQYYHQRAQEQGLPVPEFSEFEKQFYLVTLHRKLKDTGRFQYIHTVKNNPNFLPYVPLSLSYVQDALKKLDAYHELEEILKKYLPELYV